MNFLAVIWTVAVMCSGQTGAWYAGGGTEIDYIKLPKPYCDTLLLAPTAGYRWTKANLRSWYVADALFVLGHEEGHAHDPLKDECVCNSADNRRSENYADCYAAGHLQELAHDVFGFTRRDSRLFWSIEHGERYTLGQFGVVPQRCWA